MDAENTKPLVNVCTYTHVCFLYFLHFFFFFYFQPLREVLDSLLIYIYIYYIYTHVYIYVYIYIYIHIYLAAAMKRARGEHEATEAAEAPMGLADRINHVLSVR